MARHADERGTAPAILAPGRAPLSYAALYQRLRRAGTTLAAMGVGRGSRVALALPDGPEAAVATVAAMSFAACAPLPPALDARAGASLLAQLRIDALIVAASHDPPIAAAARTLGLRVIRLVADSAAPAGTFTLRAEAAGAPVQARAGDGTDVALLLQTSGTTAAAKVVPVDHAQVVFTAELLPLRPDDRALCVSPLFWYGPLSINVFSPLVAGASAVFTGGFDGRLFRDWLATFRPTFYGASPTLQAAILDVAGERRPTSLRFVRSSSRALSPAMQQRIEATLGVPVLQGYGMTECGLVAANPMLPGTQRAGSVGRAQGIEIVLRDDAGRPVAPGATGEVTVRGPGVMRGYEGDPQANREAFADGWFRTGDLGRFDADGYLYLTGRIKEIVNRGGQKISPQEVDAVFQRHPAVREAVTFPVPHPSLGEDLATAVILHRQDGATATALRDFVMAQLVPFKVPSRVVIADGLPRNAAGKVNRAGLAAALADALRTVFVPPRNDEEALVDEIFAEVLALEEVGAHHHFFQAGGDSLSGARVIARLKDLAGTDVPLSALFEAPTVAQLADRLRHAATSSQALPRDDIALAPRAGVRGRPA